MCIPSSMSQKLADYYEQTGQPEKAALQRRSIENSARVIESRAALARNRYQEDQKKTTFSKIFTHAPLCQTMLKLMALAAVIALIGTVIYNKANC